MKAQTVWGSRWENCANPLAHRVMEVAAKKKSLVCLAADVESISDLIELITEVGPYIACLLYTSPSPRDRTRSRMPSSA